MRNILVSACLLGVPCRYDGKSQGKEGILSLLEREDICLIPVCPEQLGGLMTPRVPAERVGSRVMNREGTDVTCQFEKGAEETLKLCRLYSCKTVILKEKSPSCGCGLIYDGSFSGKLSEGKGVTAELLCAKGIRVLGESGIGALDEE